MCFFIFEDFSYPRYGPKRVNEENVNWEMIGYFLENIGGNITDYSVTVNDKFSTL